MVRSPHDNASSHKCEVVKSFLASEKVKVLNLPPYSPDLSPCDFFLFPRLKKMLSGNKYTSRSSLGSAIYQCLQQIPKEDYLSAFRDWVRTLVFQYISYFRSQITFICTCLIYFSSILQIWYIEVRISRSISEFLGLRDNESRLYLTRVFSPNNRSKLGCFSRNVRTRTFGHVRSAKLQISLRIHEVWSLFFGAFLDSQGYTVRQEKHKYCSNLIQTKSVIHRWKSRNCR